MFRPILRAPVPVFVLITAASAGAQPAMTDSRYLFLFHERCATCHGVNSPVPQAASLEALRAFAPERVYEALSTGTMAVNAAELSDEEKRGLATYLTGKPFGSAVDRSAEAMPNVCASDVGPDARLARAEWNGSNADSTTGARFQSAADAGLTADEVPRLALRWSFGLPGSGGMRAQPVVVGGRVFLGSDNGFVYALDARSGCVHWSFDAGTPVVSAVSVGAVPGTEREAVYFGDWSAHVHAVDAGSGRPLWKVRVDEHPMAKITGSPVLEPGGRRLYVPVGSWEEGASLSNGQYECCTSQGSVVALDTATGSEIWKSYTIPERPRPVRENWLGVQQYGPSGAGVWAAPVLDLKRRAVYVGTANGYINVPDGGSSDAVIAFDLDTGRRLWSTQLLAGDQNCGVIGMSEEVASLECPGYASGPNDDVSGSPILVTLPSGRDVLVAGQESSRISALDPDDGGATLWVAQAQDAAGSPQGAGMGPASDGTLYYRPVALPDGTGGLAALRPDTGERVWYATHPRPTDCPDPEALTCSSGVFGAATVIPGVVFAGGRDGMLRAYATVDGEVLWEYDTLRAFETANGVAARGGSIGGHGPAIVGGMLFIGSGYAIQQSVSGNVLLAFGVE